MFLRRNPEQIALDSPNNKLNLHSLRDLERRLQLPSHMLEAISQKAGAYYQPFPKGDKQRPFAKKIRPPKRRIIDNPTGQLKFVQAKINKNLLKPITLPHYLYGGVKGNTILDNVAMHFGAPVLVTMDIRAFFPSITTFHVYNVWHDVLNCSPAISSLLTKLTTFERHLPQGAPTSTLIANLVLFSVDRALRDRCAQCGVRYSTWVDDVALSGENARSVINFAVSVFADAGFSISHRKMKIMGPRSRKILTGVVLGKFPAVLRERVSQIRSGIHKLRANEVPPAEIGKYLRSLEGSIIQMEHIVPTNGARIRTSFEEAKAAALVTA